MKQLRRPPGWEWWLDRVVLALGRTPWGRSGYGQARGLMRVFLWVERMLLRGHHVAPPRPGGIVRYEVAPYPGRPLVLSGGTVVRRGETAILLHWDNSAIASLEAAASGVQAVIWEIAKRGADDLQCLAEMVRGGVIPAEVRVVWTETVHYRMLQRVGLTTRRAARSPRTPWARLFMLCMLSIYSRPGQLDDARALRRLQLGEAWISVDELLARYADREHRREPDSQAGTH